VDECKPLACGGAGRDARRCGAAPPALGGAVQVDPIKPTLKPPEATRLKLKHDEPLATFAFKFKLRRYSWERDVTKVRRCRLTLSNPP